MKVIQSAQINPFGGLNFVLNEFDNLGLDRLLTEHLPVLANQTKYSWKDIFYSIYSIYFCGGDCIEDIGEHLKPKLSGNPFFKLPSPDRILSRLKQLSEESFRHPSETGKWDHQFSRNELLSKLNLKLLKKIGAFETDELIIDYDNTIISTEKNDCRPSYKAGLGYHPGLATLNLKHVLFLENHNGNSGANTRQAQTLEKMFDLLNQQGVDRITHFRADSASYMFDVVKVLEKNVDNFFIAAKPTYIKRYIPNIDNWVEEVDKKTKKTYWYGSTTYTPFQSGKNIKKSEANKTPYRLVVKKKPRNDKQLDLVTNEAFEYVAIITNNSDMQPIDVAKFYHQRGSMEKEIGILKNDFSWKKLPFSSIEQNTVFLFVVSMCKNLYEYIIKLFSKKFKGLSPSFRIKKFIFRFISIPAKWIKRSRKRVLRMFGKIVFKT